MIFIDRGIESRERKGENRLSLDTMEYSIISRFEFQCGGGPINKRNERADVRIVSDEFMCGRERAFGLGRSLRLKLRPVRLLRRVNRPNGTNLRNPMSCLSVCASSQVKIDA